MCSRCNNRFHALGNYSNYVGPIRSCRVPTWRVIGDAERTTRLYTALMIQRSCKYSTLDRRQISRFQTEKISRDIAMNAFGYARLYPDHVHDGNNYRTPWSLINCRCVLVCAFSSRTSFLKRVTHERTNEQTWSRKTFPEIPCRDSWPESFFIISSDTKPTRSVVCSCNQAQLYVCDRCFSQLPSSCRESVLRFYVERNYAN